MKSSIHRILLHCVAATVFTSAAPAAVISTSVTPVGPVLIGATITVSFNIAAYTEVPEIDGYNFTVDYPEALFSYVAGSLSINDGAAFGASQNWLRLPPQDFVGAGALPLTDLTVTPPPPGTAEGTVNVGVIDFRGASTRGTTAAAGFLVSFDLLANAPGVGTITPAAFPDGTVLFDVGTNPVGGTTFTGAPVTVVPEPGHLGLLLAGAVLLASRRGPLRGVKS